jgi:GNAT superfamily N-acetyltransferase
MKIFEMTRGDLIDVVRLAAQLGYSNIQDGIEERFSEIQNAKRFALFVARSDQGNVTGWIQINAEPTSLLIGARADIAALVVDEKCRGLGIGKALLLRAEEWAMENQLSLIRVRSNVKREDAHRFYQREGYTLAKTANMFTKKIGDSDSDLSST